MYYFIHMKKSNEQLHNPHDVFFKETFGRKEVAKSFFETYLPENIHNLLDFNSLEILKDTWVDKELSEHFSDIVYKVKIKKKPSFIYLLFEHKSYTDIWLYFQLLRNMVKIWENYLKQTKKANKLPAIIPIVIYHGTKPWDNDNSFASLFEKNKDIENYIPCFKAEVFDISHIPDEQIRGEVILRVLFMAEKYIFNPDLFNKLGDIFDIFNILSNKSRATEYLEVLLRYLFTTIDAGKAPELKKALKKAIKEGESLMPTIAEKWFQDGVDVGIEKGIEKGIEQGIEKGFVKGKIEDAQKMIALGMDVATIHKITGLPISKINELIKNRTKAKR